MIKLIPRLVLAIALAGVVGAQSLTTTFGGTSGQAGNMFDIVGLSDVVITNFDVNLDPGTWDVEIYTCDYGSYIGHDTTAADWTLVGSLPGVVSTASGAATSLPMTFSVPVTSCTTQGFYVTASNGISINYSYGTTEGAVFAADPNIQILEGVGKSYPFGTTFSPRVWNGTVYYTVSGMGGPQYQLNQPGSSLDVSGLTNDTCSPIQAAFLAGSPQTLNLSSTNAGQFWDIALTLPEPSLPASAGAITTPNGQIVNVNLLAPSLTSLNPGTPFVSASLPLVLPPIQLTAQMVIADPALPDGLALSAANEIASLGCQNPENFDGLTAFTTTPPPGWTNGAIGTAAWTVQAGPTSSLNTGPATGAFSAPNYMYCETSGQGFPNVQFILDTCAIDVTTLSAFTLDFQLSRIGLTIGTLHIYQDDGAGFSATPIMTYAGPEPMGLDWTAESISFVPTGSTVAFRFDYTSGASFAGDIALDDVAVQ